MEIQERPRFWSDELAEETKLWMRYLHFRPWYEDSKFVDLSPNDLFGGRYVALLSSSTTIAVANGIEPTIESFDRFHVCELEEVDWSTIDLFTSFHDIDKAIEILPTFEGRAVIGASRSKNLTFEQFKSRILEATNGRTVHFLTQSTEWPYRLSDSTDGDFFIAAIGSESLPDWPKIGLAMPTVDSPNEVREAILSYLRSYPGEIEFAVIANGSSESTIQSFEETAGAFPGSVHVIEQSTNIGYGQGANCGMEFLHNKGGFDLLGVTNDDVIADVDCLCELVAAIHGLEELGLNPGVVGPVSNQIHGSQCVELKPFSNYNELRESTYRYRSETANSVTQTRQLRGLLMLMQPKLIEAIGGFDPIFGIGNFEDDDHNLRTHLAGFTIWIADGAFLYHHGSTTFRRLDVDYQANIRRNAESMAFKWGLEKIEDWITLDEAQADANLIVPLSSWKDRAHRIEIAINGESVDLISQASDVEFAAWVIRELKHSPRTHRKRVIDAIQKAA